MAPTFFGQTMKKKSSTRYQRQMGHNNKTVYRNAATEPTDAALQRRRIKQAIGEQLDQDFQIEKFVVSERGEERRRRGWLYNISSTTVSHRVLLVGMEGFNDSFFGLFVLDFLR